MTVRTLEEAYQVIGVLRATVTEVITTRSETRFNVVSAIGTPKTIRVLPEPGVRELPPRTALEASVRELLDAYDEGVTRARVTSLTPIPA